MMYSSCRIPGCMNHKREIAGRNISNLRYADNTTLTAGSKEELKSLSMKVEEESEKAGLKLNIQKAKITISSSITSWQIDGETLETVTLYFLGLQITAMVRHTESQLCFF